MKNFENYYFAVTKQIPAEYNTNARMLDYFSMPPMDDDPVEIIQLEYTPADKSRSAQLKCQITYWYLNGDEEKLDSDNYWQEGWIKDWEETVFSRPLVTRDQARKALENFPEYIAKQFYEILRLFDAAEED